MGDCSSVIFEGKRGRTMMFCLLGGLLPLELLSYGGASYQKCLIGSSSRSIVCFKTDNGFSC